MLNSSKALNLFKPFKPHLGQNNPYFLLRSGPFPIEYKIDPGRRQPVAIGLPGLDLLLELLGEFQRRLAPHCPTHIILNGEIFTGY